MKFTMTKIAAAAALAFASTAAMAVPVAWTGGFDMYDPTGTQMDANGLAAGMTAYTTGMIDVAAGTFSLASSDPFSGLNWTASGGTLYGAGTHTISTVDATCGAFAVCASGGDITFTVGAGQIGGAVKFGWGATGGIDVVNVWDVSTSGGFVNYTSTDIDGNGILGIGMVDGPFPGFNANFNMAAPVPEASTYGMMLAGLGLVGFAVRRRKLMA